MRIRKYLTTILTSLVCVLLFTLYVNAAGESAVVGTFTSEDTVSVYVKNVSADTAYDIQVGTTQAKDVQVSNVETPQTLVMVDNSISIKESDRAKIAELLQNLIADRMNGEKIAITTFSEDTSYICDFTDDYAELKKSIDGITYNDQETYLTDVLYDLINDDLLKREESYRRLIIISDGVDNKSLGITKEELNRLLKDHYIPIYTVGCTNKKATNNDELEALFSLSRQTGGSALLLDDYNDTLDMLSVINADRDIVRYLITPDASQLDGSIKAVKISAGDTVLTVDCRMPQKVEVKGENEQPAVEDKSQEDDKPEPVIQEEEKENTDVRILGLSKVTFLLILAGIAVILIILIIVLLLTARKKKSFRPADVEVVSQRQSRSEEMEEKTEFISSGRSGETQMIWNNSQTYQIILTDINSPAKTFRIPLSNVVVLGRKQEKCDVAFDYEKSVSSRHCEIHARDGHFYLKDLESANGTYVNNSQIMDEVEIYSGNVIKMGRLEIRFEVR